MDEDVDLDKTIKEHKTLCCKSGWYVKSRANFRCDKCDRDVTLELLLLHQSIENQNQNQ